MNDNRKLVQEQFGKHAKGFITSQVHAHGYSLVRLIELSAPKPHWRVLDVATGGGHMALAFSRRANRVIAIDLTWLTLLAVRQHLDENSEQPILFAQSDSERLIFPDNTFDCVSCRIAAHHFQDPAAFVKECHRVLVPGGILALSDNVTSGEPFIAEYVNTFEKLRDPSHNWAYSLDDWNIFIETSGLSIEHSEVFPKKINFAEWAERMGVERNERTRLQATLVRCPQEVNEWLLPSIASGALEFQLMEAILIARKRS